MRSVRSCAGAPARQPTQKGERINILRASGENIICHAHWHARCAGGSDLPARRARIATQQQRNLP